MVKQTIYPMHRQTRKARLVRVWDGVWAYSGVLLLVAVIGGVVLLGAILGRVDRGAGSSVVATPTLSIEHNYSNWPPGCPPGDMCIPAN